MKLPHGLTENDLCQRLDQFQIETPSWGYADTGTRFGKFTQPAAATTIEEKFSDAGQVHLLTGVCPTMALHVLWDCPDGVKDAAGRSCRRDQAAAFVGGGARAPALPRSGS